MLINGLNSIPSYHQDFIGKSKALILLKIVNLSYFAAAGDRKGIKRAWKSFERIPALPPTILFFLPIQADWNIVWRQTLVGYSGEVGWQPDNYQEDSSRINKIIKERTLGEEWELMAELAAVKCRNKKQADVTVSDLCF